MAISRRAAELKLVREIDGLEIAVEALQGMWTIEQYIKLTDQTNHLVEYSDGVIEVLPVPTRRHQVILALLYELFAGVVRARGGITLFAPLRLQIGPGRFREPDLLVLLDQHDQRNGEAYWLGADLVLEIVSPDDPDRDLVTKRVEYAAAGIAEYWIANPLDETIVVLALAEDATYREHGLFRRGTVATSLLVPELAVDVDRIFDAI